MFQICIWFRIYSYSAAFKTISSNLLSYLFLWRDMKISWHFYNKVLSLLKERAVYHPLSVKRQNLREYHGARLFGYLCKLENWKIFLISLISIYRWYVKCKRMYTSVHDKGAILTSFLSPASERPSKLKEKEGGLRRKAVARAVNV